MAETDSITNYDPSRTGIESSLTQYAGPYVTEMLGKGKALADMPYEAYEGPLTAGPSDEAMAQIINSKKPEVFRWHDSGDVQDLDHLNKIYEVCNLTPRKRHWMPTREAWIKDHVNRAPDNLIIRFSMPMIDQEPAGSWPHVSTVISKDQPWFGATSRACPSSKQGNQCLDCRMCWDKDIKNISYWSH